jgi:formylglycine-generating enzyme required for sulfatase activity
MTDMGGGVWEYTWDTSACGDPAENPITIDVSGTDPDCSDTRNAPQITNITVDNTCSDIYGSRTTNRILQSSGMLRP